MATKIQRKVLLWLTRVRVKRRREAAIKFQRAWRTVLQRRRYLKVWMNTHAFYDLSIVEPQVLVSNEHWLNFKILADRIWLLFSLVPWSAMTMADLAKRKVIRKSDSGHEVHKITRKNEPIPFFFFFFCNYICMCTSFWNTALLGRKPFLSHIVIFFFFFLLTLIIAVPTHQLDKLCSLSFTWLVSHHQHLSPGLDSSWRSPHPDNMESVLFEEEIPDGETCYIDATGK